MVKNFSCHFRMYRYQRNTSACSLAPRPSRHVVLSPPCHVAAFEVSRSLPQTTRQASARAATPASTASCSIPRLVSVLSFLILCQNIHSNTFSSHTLFEQTFYMFKSDSVIANSNTVYLKQITNPFHDNIYCVTIRS